MRKFSPAWFIAVHAPVPLAIALRLAADQGFQLSTLPIYVAAFFLGQYAGGCLRRLSVVGSGREEEEPGNPA